MNPQLFQQFMNQAMNNNNMFNNMNGMYMNGMNMNGMNMNNMNMNMMYFMFLNWLNNMNYNMARQNMNMNMFNNMFNNFNNNNNNNNINNNMINNNSMVNNNNSNNFNNIGGNTNNTSNSNEPPPEIIPRINEFIKFEKEFPYVEKSKLKNIFLKASSGLNVLISIPIYETVRNLFRLYVKKIGLSESVLGNDMIYFLYGANTLKNYDNRKISEVFKGIQNTITVIDRLNVIGA